ncbi:MAG: hypothetical protein FK733_12160 [Asgard group archaeon]|nr:hypothetical protein [Asgard group archaeon]
MIGKRNKSVLVFACIFIIGFGLFFYTPEVNNASVTYFNLTLKAYAYNPMPDIANLIKQQLLRIGINVEIVLESIPNWDWWFYRDFDLRYFEIKDIVNLRNLYLVNMINSFYRENGSLNDFGYDITMDYSESLGTGINEWMIKEISSMIPPMSQERYELCWEWQDYLMGNFLPCVPMFSEPDYIAYWHNLVGFNYTVGLTHSWGNMWWDGTHPGQVLTNEIIIADEEWKNLNPLFNLEIRDDADEFINDLILDSLIVRDSDFSYWPHLAQSLEYIADDQIRFTLRDGIYWQDYGVFTNNPLTANDVYFTLYMSNQSGISDWIKNITKVDSKTIDVSLNYYDCIDDIAEFKILPEHFLNQTQEIDGITPDITHPSWTEYASNCFGTGLFKLEDYEGDIETTLKLNQDSWRLDSTITNDPALDYIRRYGDYSNGLDTLTIRIMPDGNTALYEFEAGKIDLIEIDRPFDKRDQYLCDPTKYVQSKPAQHFGILALNMRETRSHIGSREPCPLAPDLTVGLAIRKAIAYAINKQEISEIIFNDERMIIDHPIFPHFGKWLHPNIIRYCHNLDVANLYMLAAGFDLPWCGQSGPIDLPDWEEVCNPDYEYERITISVNDYAFLVFLAVFSVLTSIQLVVLKKLTKRREKNEK